MMKVRHSWLGPRNKNGPDRLCKADKHFYIRESLIQLFCESHFWLRFGVLEIGTLHFQFVGTLLS